MRDFVRDDALNACRNPEASAYCGAATGWNIGLSGPRLEQRAGKHNRAGVFHPAKARGADDQGQLLIRIWSNRLAEER